MTVILLASAVLLVLLCFGLHFVVLRKLSRLIKTPDPVIRRPLLVVVLSLFVVHLFEVFLYALGFIVLSALGAGGLDGNIQAAGATFEEYFYFSIASYTTLGIGDIHPTGAIRSLAGIEALNGLLLIAWSASFTYLTMEQFWTDDDPSND